MQVLGAQKQTLLNQVKNQTTIPLQTLVDLVNRYDDLEANDFQGYVDDVLLEQLHDACRDPKELDLWNQIMNNPRNTPETIQDAQRKVSTYIQQYPKAPKIKEAQELMNKLRLKRKTMTRPLPPQLPQLPLPLLVNSMIGISLKEVIIMPCKHTSLSILPVFTWTSWMNLCG